jgi:nitrite reductase/ring-hydroxylating ferredoxin subunit
MTTGTEIDSPWYEVAALAEMDPDFPIGVEVQGQKIGLFLLDGAVHAIEDVCPHAYALLSQGSVEDGVVECPLHAARFEINGGKCLNEMGQRDLRCFPVKIEADRVWVQVPQA